MSHQYYLPAQIDDANLAYYYDLLPSTAGNYYQLKQGVVANPHLPLRFWVAERTQGEEEGGEKEEEVPQSQPQPQQESKATPQVQVTPTYSYQYVATNPVPVDQIVTIRVVAHTLGPIVLNGDLSQNHWTIYMLLSASGSVQINMKTDTRPGMVQGIYEVSRRGYTESQTAVRWWDFSAVVGLTVAHIEHEINTSGWHKYNMTASGVGCRHWILTVLRGLATRGWVNANDIETLLVPALQFNYSKNLSRVPMPILEGSFY